MRRAAAEVLIRLGDFPKTKRQLVHLAWEMDVWLGKLLRQESREIALADLENAEMATAERGVYMLIKLGVPETVLPLVRILNQRGNRQIGEWFFHCGQPELRQAAERWSDAKAISVETSPWYAGPHWGQ
ncbi:MAG: hypothetical protein RMI90_03105 [Thermoguttaceae bacterium]|nr:hypothetical protein [Thermoguttaceae bacterium]